MEKETLVVEVGKPVHGGACIAEHSDGRKLFVRGALPGEKVRIALIASHKKYAWAEVIDVITPSANRVPHIWPEAQAVGGGGVELGHVTPAYQREWKGLVLQEQLLRLGGDEVIGHLRELSGGTEVKVQPAPGDAPQDETADPLLGRRTRVQLFVGEDGKLGMRKYRSHDLVSINSLPIADPRIAELDVFEDEKWMRHWRPKQRVSLEAPTADDPVVVTPRGAFTAPGKKKKGNSLWRATANEQSFDFPVRPGGFWQTHREAPNVLAQAVLDGAKIRPGDTVAELYSGAGLFTRFLAEAALPGGEVITLEGDQRAIDNAAAGMAGLVKGQSLQLFQGNVTADNVRLLLGQTRKPVDVIVLDPPRKGAGKEVIQQLSESSASRIVLISCDPAAGARDIGDLVAGGFTLKDLQAWDLFPHTHHFETVAVLERTN